MRKAIRAVVPIVTLVACSTTDKNQHAAGTPSSVAAQAKPTRWRRLAESTAVINSASTPPVAASVLLPKFVAALRAELPNTSVELSGDDVVITRGLLHHEVGTKALGWQCPQGEGDACDAAIRALAKTTAHDILEPPSCTGKVFDPALMMEPEVGDDIVTARVAGRLFVGVAAYSPDRTVRAWCSGAEAGVSADRLLAWARDRVAALPPPPVEPMPKKEGAWMIIERGEMAPYFLHPEQLLAAMKNPTGRLVAVVPTEQMILLTTSDRTAVVKEFREAAQVYAKKAGARGLSDEVYEWRDAAWHVLPP
jgi:hypothetical protein